MLFLSYFMKTFWRHLIHYLIIKVVQGFSHILIYKWMSAVVHIMFLYYTL